MVPGTLVVLVALLAQIVPPDFARRPSRKLWRDGISGWGPEVTAAWMAKRTPRTSWTRRGWNAFRWGMGPADVADRLRDANGDFRASAPEGWDICVSVKGAEPPEARCRRVDRLSDLSPAVSSLGGERHMLAAWASGQADAGRAAGGKSLPRLGRHP